MVVGIQDFPAFCLAVLVFLALPGPGTLTLLAATGRGGFRAGAVSTAGLMAGDQVLLWAAVAGVAALLAASPGWFHALQWAGAAYLAWLGLKLLLKRASPPEDRPDPGRPVAQGGRYFRQAFMVTVLNPKAIVFYLAFFPLFLPADGPVAASTYAAMAVTIAVLTAVYCLALCALAKAVAQQVRRHRRLARLLERLTGLFLIGFGLRLVRG